MRLPGSPLPALLLLLSTAALRCLGATTDEADPNVLRHGDHQKNSNDLTTKHSVTEFSSSVNSNVVVEKPTTIELSCELSGSEAKIQPPIEVIWMHGEENINSTEFAINNTESKWHTWYKFDVSDSSKLGNYTCIFKSTLEAKAIFHLKVPKVKGGDKPMVSYESDTVVMKCDAAKHKPVEWIWYRNEENNKVVLNDSLMSSKYEITRKYANESKLHIKELSGNDSGLYSCEAVFLVGKSQGNINLSVLSYMVPLKPFLVIVAEVIVLVSIILVYEMHNKKKKARSGEDEKEAEQSVHLKPEDTNGVESDTTRQRKV